MAYNTIRKSSHPISCFFSILPHGQFFIVFLFFWERKSCIHGISGQATIHHLPASCCSLPAPPLPARGITCPDPAPGRKSSSAQSKPPTLHMRLTPCACTHRHTHTDTWARHALAEGPPGGAAPSVDSTTVPQMIRWLGRPPRLRNTFFTRPRGAPLPHHSPFLTLWAFIHLVILDVWGETQKRRMEWRYCLWYRLQVGLKGEEWYQQARHQSQKQRQVKTSLAVQRLSRPSRAGGALLTPGRGAQIPHATWHGQKNKDTEETLKGVTTKLTPRTKAQAFLNIFKEQRTHILSRKPPR